ncbi:MAG: 2,3-bisphosphoglycerate-independent phosphoglycerate mutase [candidate division Zixibacteria bacterium]|nr:2,3-bisphosphoglycerate-independent phosphoglycerate mutase [candidate division Zixibacteria bacterium]
MILLLVMDGYGLSPQKEGNAIAFASKPHLDEIFVKYAYTTLGASGLDVGLPEGQMGNSEVGHLNLGAGRVVYQEITRIDKAIEEKAFFENPVLVAGMETTKQRDASLHLLGLVSDGCVHSSPNHLYALLELAKEKKVKKVFVHAFLDGRDTSPTAGAGYIQELLDKFKELGIGKLATVAGRYYAMDRDKRWDRVEKAYKAIVNGEGIQANDAISAIRKSYTENVTDEFMVPMVVRASDNPQNGRIKKGDVGIFFNFRADRARQLSYALTDQDFGEFPRTNNLTIDLISLTLYDEKLKCKVAFPPIKLTNILGEVLEREGKAQLRIAETEKYAHVTFFFNVGEEKPFEGEDRILVHSPKVATYDLKPEMSAFEVTQKVTKEIKSNKYDFILLNYANPDMVGHTGVLSAAIKAVETMDKCVGEVIAAVREVNGIALVTGDHGNAEKMIDPGNGGVFTAHTTNRVPFALVMDDFKGKLKEDGKLADIAPTILHLMNLKKPEEMEGENLII